MGISEATLHHRLCSPNYPEYTFEYHAKVNVRRKGHPCTINGVEYRSQQAATDALGISSDSLRSRLRSSKFPQYIPHRHPKVARKPKKQPCTISGVEYESQKAAARAFDVHVTVLQCRLRSSNYPEYISRYHPKERRRKQFISCSVAGVEYTSLADASRGVGIAVHEMRRRLASADYPDYACTTIPKKPWKPPRYTVRGKPYKSLREVAEMEGVTGERIRQKMKNPAYPDYISVDIPKDPPPRPRYMVRGRHYRTLQEIAEAEREQKEIIRQKMESTLHPDYVSPRIAKRPPQPSKYMANGKPYKTKREIAKAEGITVNRVDQRLDDPSCLEYQQLYKRRT